jgi:hypothetical protein
VHLYGAAYDATVLIFSQPKIYDGPLYHAPAMVWMQIFSLFASPTGRRRCDWHRNEMSQSELNNFLL